MISLAFRPVLAWFCLTSLPALASPWPQWRGPAGTGVSGEIGLLESWDGRRGVLWKREIPVRGFSSPVVWGDRIFLTGAEEDKRMKIIAVQASDGLILWQREFEGTAPAHGLGGYHNAASPTPCTDGRVLVAFFSTGDLFGLDLDGKTLWKRALAAEFGDLINGQGMASSPVPGDGRVFLLCDHQQSYLLAIETETGKTIWKRDRRVRDSWSTPVLFHFGDGDQLVTASSQQVIAYNPASGQELWTGRGISATVVPSPVFGEGIVFTTSGRNGPTLAIRPGGRGDVTATHVEWRLNRGGPYVPSPVCYQKHLYVVTDNGVCTCLDAASGAPRWSRRLERRFTASPVAADGRIYFLSESGETFVFEPGPSGRLLAVNPLGEPCMASPALSQGCIYIRSERHLFALGSGHNSATTAAAAPGTAQPDPTLEQLFEALKAPEMRVRVQAVEQIGSTGNPRALPELARVMREDHWDVAEVSIKAIARLGKPAVPVLIEALGDSRPFIRWEAAAGLGSLGDLSAGEALTRALADPAAPVRASAAEALGRIGGEATVKALLEILRDPEGSVRQSAIAALGTLQARNALPGILESLRDPERLVRKQAVETLVSLGGDEAFSALKQQERTEPDQALRARIREVLP
ncbi:MAG: HEAT repeat domain-containing protein [Planctomycetes bacterium]|nr:HEAT repeat domain-containing protein [Planctomycetota bacterium]